MPKQSEVTHTCHCQHLRDCENQEFKASLIFIERLFLNFSQIMGWHLKKPATEMWGPVFQTRAGVGHRVGQRG